MLAFAVAVLALGSTTAWAQPAAGGSTYQRKGTHAGDWKGHGRDWRHRQTPEYSSQTSFGSFQRPYPYHLDYYRARWGGSYAPYFGNLYGPPNYFLGTPYFGGLYGGYGGYGFVGGGYGREPVVGGVPFGPWQDGVGPGGAPYAAPFEGGALEGSVAEGPVVEYPAEP